MDHLSAMLSHEALREDEMTPKKSRGGSELTSCQTRALDMLKTGRNVFVTGAAGTGKSFLINTFMAAGNREKYPIVASTGAAAILVGGRTFHSFFGLGIMEGGIDGTIHRAVRNKKLVDRLRKADGIVIDEVSMLPGITLRVAEAIARRVRDDTSPWGGMKVIAVGDFAQLPPVGMNEYGGKDWGFMDECWDRSHFANALLQTTVRTTEPEFLQVLQSVREGRVTPQVVDFLESHRAESNDAFEGTRLFAHRATAETHNREKLERIKGPMIDMETMYDGDRQACQQLRKNAPIPERLFIKVGALVMLRRNDHSPAQRWVNGSLGHVIAANSEVIDIELLDGREIQISKQSFSALDGNGKEVATAWNFPINLAWATTIHKAQGATVDNLMVDLSRLWEPGQAYVALSRVRSSNGLRIENWKPSGIIAEPSVSQFYAGLARE